MKDREFAARLKKACDDSPDIPPPNEGRQVVLSQKMGISQEAARKYFEGIARPRPTNMRKLAEILGVDEAWLALGVEPLMPQSRKTSFARLTDSSAMLVYSIFASNGYSCAFNEKSKDDGVDFYAIRSGVQYSIAVTTALESDKTLHLPVKLGYENHINVVVVPVSKTHRELLHITTDLVKECGKRKGGVIEVLATSKRVGKEDKFICGEYVIPTLEDSGLL